MPRVAPCRDCKKRRRKCVRQTESPICVRCEKSGQPCIFDHESDSNSDDDELAAEDGNKDLKMWIDQVVELQNELDQLQGVVRDLQPQAEALSYLRVLTSPANRNEVVTPDGSAFQWKLSVVNGMIRLETNIKSIKELLMYTQASIRYLSPFSGLFKEPALYFVNRRGSLIPIAIKSVTRTFAEAERRAIVLRSDIAMYATKVIDRFVSIYFQVHNIKKPIVHEASYRAYYNKLKDPTQCAVTMAICVFVAVNLKDEYGLSAAEKRALADYFYLKCRTILQDIFDDPKRKIETVVSINLLMKYLTVVSLQMQDARRWATIAHLICESTYPNLDREPFDEIQREIFKRHRLLSGVAVRILDFAIEDVVPQTLPSYDLQSTLPGESFITQQYMEVYNHMSALCFSSFINNVVNQIRKVASGDTAEISLESIFRFEQIILEWWTALPDDLRICDNPFDVKDKSIIETCECDRKLLVFGFVQSLTTTLHASLLTPRLPRQESGELTQMMMMLSERAYDMTIRGSELMLITVKRIERLDVVEPFLFLHTIDTLNSVINAGKTRSTDKARELFYECLAAIECNLPKDHRFATEKSPLASYLKSNEVGALTVYADYPLSGYAFLHDLVQTSAKHLGHIHNIKRGLDTTHLGCF